MGAHGRDMTQQTLANRKSISRGLGCIASQCTSVACENTGIGQLTGGVVIHSRFLSDSCRRATRLGIEGIEHFESFWDVTLRAADNLFM